ncbi:uncharacterized protein LOC128737271 [Sabethes cyaneus]|uniref:uncharacterized protein LOC128737271 n=1 Tax=Sabethes cyaneus TaxID=53552 RepID=UPI00237EBC99|nr:uncharacterized protein LOC128737271 [Sabethes cyaneus]
MGSKSEKKRTFRTILTEVTTVENGFVCCRIDTRVKCDYKQKQVRLDCGNFIRHVRVEHGVLAKQVGLLPPEDCPEEKKRKVVRKVSVAIDRLAVTEAIVKLVTIHHLPPCAVEWEGMRTLLNPISKALGISLDRFTAQSYVDLVANAVREIITTEVKCRLISVKIDSACRQSKQILAINSQFAVNGEIVVRSLGIIELKEKQTAKQLKTEIIRILDNYNISVEQVFSVTYDNGVNQLQQPSQPIDATEVSDNDDATEEAAATLTLDGLKHELGKSIDLVRCAVHIMQPAVTEVVDYSDREIGDITLVAKNCRKPIYETVFDQVTLPPLHSKTSWGSVFLVLEHFCKNEQFFKNLGSQYSELDLSGHWDYIKDYVAAFTPVYNCVKNMQGKHVSLADFNLRWIHTIFEVGKLGSTNRFALDLSASLNRRLASLKNSMAYNCALFVDPRVHYYKSTLFDAQEKDKIKKYIAATWEKFSQLQSEPAAKVIKTEQGVEQDEMDLMISKMFGGSNAGISKEVPLFEKQLNTLDVEQRKTTAVDLWDHWMGRKGSHPELHALASIFLAVPSNQVAVERAYGALDLVLSDMRTEWSDGTLHNILIVKSNRQLLDRALKMAEPQLLALDDH